ncbi:replication initiation and membrane attachment family protein [Lacticaseibacillus porcinae]|uniref:replication initiation and membrane attachment family protein n=1 Tax=Lacticaseibacillus porcinae TaxID=1123687 RepID=UPI000F7A63E8|nr:replication initiation protein [Lacticaseibacillus porcinae]
MERPQNFMAQDDYLVAQATYFSNVDQHVAVSLYQPLVGPVAMALYLSLWQEAKPRPLVSDRRSQTRLLDLLNIGVDTLYDARVHLEAVGLMKTYTTTDAISRYYAYELYAPVSPQAFFNDDLLGMLLYDRVGDARYTELAQEFALHPVRRDDWQEVSANFLDVYHLTNVLATPKAAIQAQQALALKATPTVSLDDDGGYDWELLASTLARTTLQAGELDKNRAALYEMARFYGLEVPEFSLQIRKAIEPMTGKLNMRQLRQFIEQSYRKADKPAFSDQKTQQPAATPAPPTIKDLTSQEADLLKRANTQAPRTFLENTKKAKNSRAYAASNETYALRELLTRHVFPDATVNILIDYVLRSYDSLSQALLNGFVQRWITANVTTPESAILQIRKEAQQPVKNTRGKRPNRQEETPDWMKPDYQPVSKPVSVQSKQSIQAGLDRLKAMRKKGSES